MIKHELKPGVPQEFAFNELYVVGSNSWKCDTRVIIEAKLGDSPWYVITTLSQTEGLRIPKSSDRRATLHPGAKQTEPVFVYTDLPDEPQKKQTNNTVGERLNKTRQLPKKPVASGVQLRHSSPRNDKGGSGNSTSKA